MSACKKHATDPVRGYADCPGCEIERLVRERHEAQRDRDAAQAEARELRARTEISERGVLAQGALIEELRADLARVREAAEDFVAKVESGRARSVDSYNKFKEALATGGDK